MAIGGLADDEAAGELEVLLGEGVVDVLPVTAKAAMRRAAG